MAYTPLLRMTQDLGKFKSLRPQPYQQQQGSLFGSSRGLTAYEQELTPYVEQAKQKFNWKKQLWQPIQLVFDILSRGQYMTANMAQQITGNLRSGQPTFTNVAQEAWQGITGAQKGDWKTVIFGGEDTGGEAFRGWAQDWGDQLQETKGGRFLKGLIGFGANIVLDPTTYINPVPAMRSVVGARAYADDVVKLFSKQMTANFDELGSLVKKGLDPDKLAEMISLGTNATRKYISQFSTDIPRMMDKLYKTAYKTGLRTPAGKLADDMAKQIENIQTTAWDNFLTKAAGEGKTLDEFYDIAENIPGTDVLGLDKLLGDVRGVGGTPRYAGTGQRAWRVMGKEIMVSERYPALLRQWDTAIQKFQQSKVGGFFSDAWWNTMGKPDRPIGWLKQLFNVKSPYQQMMDNIVLDATSMTPWEFEELGSKMAKSLAPFAKDDVTKTIIKDVLYEAQGTKGFDFMKALANRNITGDKAVEALRVIDDINVLNGKLLQRDKDIIEPILGKKVGNIKNYLPIMYDVQPSYRRGMKEIGPSTAGYQMKRTVTPNQEMSRATAQIQFMLGLSKEDAAELARQGIATNAKMDLEELLYARILSQARLEQKANIIKQIREFGINIDDAKSVNPELYRSLLGDEGSLELLGLRKIPKEESLQKYLFDPEAAKILERALNVSSSDAALKKLGQHIGQFTGWWRAWATFSPGFHFRNMYSNQITGVLKHGPEWFSPQKQFDAFIGSVRGLHGEDAFAKLKGMGYADNVIKGALNRKYGEFTLEQLADKAAQQGVITRATMGFDIESTIEKFSQKGVNLNPLSRTNVALNTSHEFGSIVESQSRFASFLLDYSKGLKGGANPDAVFEFAKLEAKKWFIDYSDLSAFEQKVMKNIIPFYTWLRKNIANQINAMIDFREMYSIIPKAQRAAQGAKAEYLPEYMREEGYFPLWKDDKEGVLKMFWPNFPYQDINKLPVKFHMTDKGIPVPIPEPREFINTVLSAAHPLIKTAMEILPDEPYHVFYRTTLGETTKAPDFMQWFNKFFKKNPKLVQFLDGTLRAVGVENGLGFEQDSKGNMRMNSRIVQLLENNALPLERMVQFYQLPEYFVPAFERLRRTMEDKKPRTDYERVELGLQVLSFYAGVKMKMVKEEEIAGREADEIMKEAEKQLKKARRQEPGYQQRSLTAIQNRLKRQRKLGVLQ